MRCKRSFKLDLIVFSTFLHEMWLAYNLRNSYI